MYQTFGKILQGDDRVIMKNVETNFITHLYNVSPAAKLMSCATRGKNKHLNEMTS